MDPTLTHLFASITPPEGRQECPTETRPNLTEAVSHNSRKVRLPAATVSFPHQ